MGVVRSGHFWQLCSIASLATETTSAGPEAANSTWYGHCGGSVVLVN